MTTDVLHRNLTNAPPAALRSAGRHILHTDVEATMQGLPISTAYFDLSSGAGVTGLGHSNIYVKEAMIEQIHRMPYVHAGQWTSSEIEAAGSAILSRAGDRFAAGGVTFFSGGAEAVEAACKITMQFCAVTDRPPAMFISRQHSYHGGTMFTLKLGDHPRRVQTHHQRSIQANHLYRFDAFAPHLINTNPSSAVWEECEAASLRSLADALEIVRSRHATPVVVMEPIGGTAAMIAPPTVSYLEGVRTLANKHGAVLIYDEILGGNFRTGHLMSWQFYQQVTDISIAPDIAVVGKGITAGYFPMSAVLVSEAMRHYLASSDHQPRLWATATNQNHPIGAAAVTAAMEQYDNMLCAVGELSQHMIDFAKSMRRLDQVHSVQGVGTLYGVSLDPKAHGLHSVAKRQLFDLGVVAYTDGGTIKGEGNMVLVAPPFGTTPRDLNEVVSAFAALKL